jgi:hypothetical protein
MISKHASTIGLFMQGLVIAGAVALIAVLLLFAIGILNR